MKSLKYLIILFVFCYGSLSTQAQDKDLNNKITKNLRCLICQGQSIYDSDSEFANSLKILVSQKIADGQNEEQIYGYLQEKYGQGGLDLETGVFTPNN